MIIGFGHRAGSGKDTAAKAMAFELDCPIGSFAEPMRRFAGHIYGFHKFGYLNEEAYARFKEEIQNNGKTGGAIMQAFGTSCKELFGPDVFIKLLDANVQNLQGEGYFIIPDLRFIHEAQYIKDKGGICIRIHRPSVEETYSKHESEAEGYDIDWDLTIPNDGTKQQFEDVVTIMARIISAAQLDARARGERFDLQTLSASVLAPLLSRDPKHGPDVLQTPLVLACLEKHLDSY